MPRRLRDSLEELNSCGDSCACVRCNGRRLGPAVMSEDNLMPPPPKRQRPTSALINYRDVIINAFEYYQQEAMGSIDALLPRTHMAALQTRAKRKTECVGDRRVERIRKILDKYPGFTRSAMQKQFHESFLQATALHLYRDDADVDFDGIMRMNDWENLKQQVLCLTPRRFGKTTAVSMFACAFALCVPKSTQCIFSTGKRASDSLLEKVTDFAKSVGEGHRLKRRGEVLYVYGDKEGDVRKVSSYPSGSEKLRGVGGDVIYLEEAAFMSIKMFHEVIVPLLELETTALICISTPQGTDNFYSQMFQMKDAAGKKLFNSIELSLVCDECKAGPDPASCTHMKHLLPRWKSGAKNDMVRQIYGDNTTDMLRESLGMTTEASSSLFDAEWINGFAGRNQYVFRAAPKFVWIACDPNGGGASEMGIVSLTMENNNYVILSIEHHEIKGHGEIKSLLQTHVRALRGLFPSSIFIFIPESNLGHEASHMAHMLKREPRLHVMTEKTEPGVITTHRRKELYANFAIEQFAAGSMHYWKDFLSTNPFRDANSRSKKAVRSFNGQLKIFSRVVIPSKALDGKPKIIYSGKQNGNDDLVMTFLIGLYWSMMFMTGRSTPCYKDF